MEIPRVDNAEQARSFVQELGHVLGADANVATVFGQPVERNDSTVIPVARVRYGLGGGLGLGPRTTHETTQPQGGSGGGGGGGAQVTPAGFIHLRNGSAEFRSIPDPRAEGMKSFALLAGLGLSVWFLLHGVRSLYRH